MSTRCQIGFYEADAKDLNQWEALLYRHSDGYPDSDAGVPKTIVPILTDFNIHRGLSDIEYASAWLVAKLKDGYLNIGICKDFHGDIEYYYAVYADGKLEVYETPTDNPADWKLLNTFQIRNK